MKAKTSPKKQLLTLIVSALFLGSISPRAQASKHFKFLAEELLKVNSSILKTEHDWAKSKLDKDILEASKRWSLGAAGAYNKDELQRLNSFSFAKDQTKSLNLRLSKDFTWGGQFYYNPTYTHFDQEGSGFIVNKHQSQVLSTVGYTQDLGKDFFGRQFRLQKKMTHNKSQLVGRELDLEREKNILGFYGLYMQAYQYKTYMDLQKQAIERAKRRKATVKGLVSDGLREKIDFYSSEVQLLSQQEQLEQYQYALQDVLDQMAQKLHRSLTIKEIGTFDFEVKKLPQYNFKELLVSNNIALKMLENSISITKDNIQFHKNEIFPDIKFKFEGQLNSVDDSANDVYKNTFDTDEGKGYEVSLNVTIPLGFTVERDRLAQQRIDLLTQNMQVNKLLYSLKAQREHYIKKVKTQGKIISSTYERIALARKSLASHKRLYRLGRIDFDRYLRAEEDLISTQFALVKNWITYELDRARVNQLAGNATSFLLHMN